MKILIVSDAWHPQINGVVRTYEHLSEELWRRGHFVKIIGPEDFNFRMPMPGYSEIELALFPYRKLAKMIERFSPDVVHISVEGPLGWAARKWCLKNDMNFSTSYHTQFPQYFSQRIANIHPSLIKSARRLGQWYIKKFHSPARAMMIATESLEHDLRILGFEHKSHRLTRGVDLDIFYPAGVSDAWSPFMDKPKPIALFVGRIAIEKNLEAFLEMEWEGTKVIVGDGPSRKYLQKKYPEAYFVGKKIGKDLADYYRCADVFTFPSKTDTFGIVLIEALACGLPVAAYPVIGPKDIITKSELGCLDQNLSKASYEALQRGSPEQRHLHVKKYYTWERTADQFLEANQIENTDTEKLYNTRKEGEIKG